MFTRMQLKGNLEKICFCCLCAGSEALKLASLFWQHFIFLSAHQSCRVCTPWLLDRHGWGSQNCLWLHDHFYLMDQHLGTGSCSGKVDMLWLAGLMILVSVPPWRWVEKKQNGSSAFLLNHFKRNLPVYCLVPFCFVMFFSPLPFSGLHSHNFCCLPFKQVFTKDRHFALATCTTSPLGDGSNGGIPVSQLQLSEA